MDTLCYGKDATCENPKRPNAAFCPECTAKLSGLDEKSAPVPSNPPQYKGQRALMALVAKRGMTGKCQRCDKPGAFGAKCQCGGYLM